MSPKCQKSLMLGVVLVMKAKRIYFQSQQSNTSTQTIVFALPPRRTMLHSKSPPQRPILVNFTIITSIAFSDEERLHQV